MRMMAFITPLAQISTQIRDHLIDILRKAMYQRDLDTRKLSVFGFCSILKHLRLNNSRRGTAGMAGTQLTISGFSLSQSYLDTSRNSQRHFDILALEIIGILRKCFNQTHEIKETLYDCLINAVDGNLNITPHIIQFLELHFRAYFQIDGAKITINVDKIIGANELQINDHLGKLIKCIGHCIILCDQGALDFDTAALKKFFHDLVHRIALNDLDALNSVSEHLFKVLISILECTYI